MLAVKLVLVWKVSRAYTFCVIDFTVKIFNVVAFRSFYQVKLSKKELLCRVISNCFVIFAGIVLGLYVLTKDPSYEDKNFSELLMLIDGVRAFIVYSFIIHM